jgi:hypothetical protein
MDESLRQRDPANWKEVRVHTALCEVCNQRNGNILYKCRDCSWSICTPCLANRNGNRGHRNCLHQFSPTANRAANLSSGPSRPIQTFQGSVQQAQPVQVGRGRVQQDQSTHGLIRQVWSAPHTQSAQPAETAPALSAQDHQRDPRAPFARHTKRTYEASNTGPESGISPQTESDSEEEYVTESEDDSDYEKTEKRKRSGTRRPRKDGLPSRKQKKISKKVLLRNHRLMNKAVKEESKNAKEPAEKRVNPERIGNEHLTSETTSEAALTVSTGAASTSNTVSTINSTMARPHSKKIAARRRRAQLAEESGQISVNITTFSSRLSPTNRPPRQSVPDAPPAPSLNSRVTTAMSTDSLPSGNGLLQGIVSSDLPTTHFELFDNSIQYEVHVNRPEYSWRIRTNMITIQLGSTFVEDNVENNVFEFNLEKGYGSLYQFSDHYATPDDVGYFRITANHVNFKISFKPNYSFEVRRMELVLFRDEPFFFVGAISIPTDTFPLIPP